METRLTASRAGFFVVAGQIHDNQITHRSRRRAIAHMPDSFGPGKHTGPMEASR